MYAYILNILFCLLLYIPAFCQDPYNYVQYDTRDGLAGSTVYSMAQDKDGFMWFATENGLSRFDGTRFKTFTVKDGLPDNEVLKLFTDSRGRLWICCLSKYICYYYKGKIYDRNNDSAVARIKLTNTIRNLFETKEGSIAFCDANQILLLNQDNSITNVSELAPIRDDGCPFRIIEPDYLNGGILVWSANLYHFGRQGFNQKKEFFFRGITRQMAWLKITAAETVSTIPISSPVISYETVALKNAISGNLFINTTSGSWLVDTVKGKLARHFLPGKKISHTLIDAEQNTWFSTLGQGVFKLPSRDIFTVSYSASGDNSDREVFTIFRNGQSIEGGLNGGKGLKVKKNGETSVTDYAPYLKNTSEIITQARLYTSKALSSGEILLGFDVYMLKLRGESVQKGYIYPVKDIAEISKDTLLVALSHRAVLLRTTDLTLIDTLWLERCTKVFYTSKTYYLGTLNGLYEVQKDKTSRWLGKLHPSLARRIAGIEMAEDGNLWIATGDEGVVAYRPGGGIIHVLKDSNGLSSNICRSLFVKDNFLWVGTNKGLNKVDISHPSLPVLNYSVSDGLPSDAINDIFIEDSLIWVATSAGLTRFTEKNISRNSICRLQLLQVSIGGIPAVTDSSYQLSYRNSSISFEYSAISFKSGGEIAYYYRLKGLEDESWKQTTDNSLNYQALPPGNYEFELYAINKFGVTSSTIRVKIVISKPFWLAWWFYVLSFLVVTGGVVWVLAWRNKKLQQRLEEKNLFERQMAALEQQALQSQMNPHFIFNCLNSIQQYVLTNNKEKANQYLTGFASLIRQTLDNSGKKSITVADEIRYLKQYIAMEQMRFGNNFTCQVQADASVRTDYAEIPAMLLQPYVENSLRHGIRNKQDGDGKLDILFKMEGNVLCCSIKDNGVGREKAMQLKSFQHIEYQSKGMSLTSKRVDLLNKMRDDYISVTIVDLKDSNGNATGTEVLLKIPL